MLAGDPCERAYVEGEARMEPAHSCSYSVAWDGISTLVAATWVYGSGVWGLP